MSKAIKAMDEKISAYLGSLDQADAVETDQDEPTPSAAELREKIESLQQRKAKYQALKQELKESGAKQVSLTDRDARFASGHEWQSVSLAG